MGRWALAIAGLACGAGCSFLTSFDGLTGGGADASVTDGTIPDGPARLDGGEDGAADASDALLDAGACKVTGGPAMIRVNAAFCIDATEVTNAEYAAFLSAVGTSVRPGLPGACAFKTTHIPNDWPRGSGFDAYPVIEVDWCDAWAFCAWAGKSMCGAIGGGPAPASAAADPTVDAWYLACSGGAHTYPYGDTFDPARCNGPSAGHEGGAPAGTFAQCTGGVPGLSEMSGNLQEWEDSCGADAGTGDPCADRGGAWHHYDTQPGEQVRLRCDHRDTSPRGSRLDNLGIRCCAY